MTLPQPRLVDAPDTGSEHGIQNSNLRHDEGTGIAARPLSPAEFFERGTEVLGTGSLEPGAENAAELVPALEYLPRDAAPDFFVTRRPQAVFRALQTWEGEVLEIGADEFSARLRDLTDATRADEVATLPVDDVPQDDRRLMAVGAVFYWHIGYLSDSYGQLQRSSRIRFRRLPGWTRSDLKRMEEKADELERFLSGSLEPTE